MQFSTAAAFLTAFAAANALVIRQQPQNQGPFALYISQSQNPAFQSKYVAPSHAGAAQDLAAVSDQPMQIFYTQNGQLFYYFQTAEGQTFQTSAGFSSEVMPGQTMQPMYFVPAGGSGVAPPPPTNGTAAIQPENSFVISNEAHLTVRGSANWFACTNTQGAPGTPQQVTAINLLVGAQPMDPSCASVVIDVVTVRQQPGKSQ